MKPYQMNIAMIVMLLAGLDGGLALAQVETPPFQERPNVLFILTDDQRYDALSCMGHPYLKTPHIDGLANEGLLFKNHFCTTSLCSPSRASILSGLYAHSHGVSNNFTESQRAWSAFQCDCKIQAIKRPMSASGTWVKKMICLAPVLIILLPTKDKESTSTPSLISTEPIDEQ